MRAITRLGVAAVAHRRHSSMRACRALSRTVSGRHAPSRATAHARTTRMATTTPDDRLVTDVFFLDDFAIRQWDDERYSGTRIAFDKAEFVKRVHDAHVSGASPLVDGYAPFCKHVFVPNFVGAKVGCVSITEANAHKLKSGYSSRSPAELAVLTRWFQASDVEIPEATHLDVILYSREQLELERAAVPSKGERPPLPDAPWGIISIKAQSEDYETPMQPITMMRNALGREEGGSGVPLDREKYDASVKYWSTHAPIVVSEDGANGD